jgi:formylglycine-generating enzyme
MYLEPSPIPRAREGRHAQDDGMNFQTPQHLPADEMLAVPDMARIPSSTFRIGWDHDSPEEAPVHRMMVSSFWIDRIPVTNR